MKPKLYQEFETLEKLYQLKPSLQRLFNSIFSACTINLGPQTITLPHFNYKNKRNRVISLCSLGNFDYKKRGHVIFKTLEVAIEFPSGCAILFPSAVIEHALFV